MIEKIDFVAREPSAVVWRQQDAIAERIAAVLQERKRSVLNGASGTRNINA